jgi:hypothetical protein
VGALAVEALDGREAVERALVGDMASAVDALWKARHAAPERARAHPMARETVYALARRERRASDTLRGLAHRIGLPD